MRAQLRLQNGWLDRSGRTVDGTKMLPEIFTMRDVALIRADARIGFLTGRPRR
jgi:hypothetical protein